MGHFFLAGTSVSTLSVSIQSKKFSISVIALFDKSASAPWCFCIMPHNRNTGLPFLPKSPSKKNGRIGRILIKKCLRLKTLYRPKKKIGQTFFLGQKKFWSNIFFLTNIFNQKYF